MNKEDLLDFEAEIRLELNMPVARATTTCTYMHSAADVKCKRCNKVSRTPIAREKYLWSQNVVCDICGEKTPMTGSRYFPN